MQIDCEGGEFSQIRAADSGLEVDDYKRAIWMRSMMDSHESHVITPPPPPTTPTIRTQHVAVEKPLTT